MSEDNTIDEPTPAPESTPEPMPETTPQPDTTDSEPKSDVRADYGLDDESDSDDTAGDATDDKTDDAQPEYAVEWPEDYEASDELTEMVNAAAREVGVSDKALGAYTARMIEQLEAKHLASIEADDAALKETWGRDFLANKKEAQSFARRVMNEAGLSKEDMQGFMNPKGFKVLYALSQKMGSGKAHGIERKASGTEISWAKTAMTDRTHADYKALNDVRDPRHKEVTARYFRAMGAKLN